MKKVVKLLGMGLGYFIPVLPILYTVIFLFAVDWITGVWKSIKFHKKIRSYRLRQSVDKLVSYIIVVIATYCFQKRFIGEDMHLVNIVAGYISMTELISIYENLSVITGKEFLKDLIILVKEKYIKKKSDV